MAPPPAKKRRISTNRSATPESKDETPNSPTNNTLKTKHNTSDETSNPDHPTSETSTADQTQTTNPPADEATPTNSQPSAHHRLARFAQLKSRATQSARSNLAEAKAEAQRSALDPGVLASLSRKSAIASHNLLKADTEEEGGKGAFERKRAWDYTIEESEKWDERMAQKRGARDNNAFADYSAEAGKVYDRQIRELEKLARSNGAGGGSRDEYEAEKRRLIDSAARSGGLEVVEMENGEIVAIDREGRFYADSENTGFTEQKPKKENVDRLVEDLRKADEARMKKRRDRGRDEDGKEGDVTYINEKNKQFNRKLARFYDRYTTDIRESFERGTAI